LRESLVPSNASVDFILQAHEDPLGKIDFAKLGFDPSKSRSRIVRVLEGDYVHVLVEGSAFDGFSWSSRVEEMAGRMRYEWRDPALHSLGAAGLRKMAEASVDRFDKNPYGPLTFWTELDKRSSASFKAAESLPILVLQGKFISREISATRAKEQIESLHRMRSAIALAKAIRASKEASGGRVAVVFGFLHEKDFREMASALGIRARIYNATGTDWAKIRSM
jgi:hypothetical protein